MAGIEGVVTFEFAVQAISALEDRGYAVLRPSIADEVTEALGRVSESVTIQSVDRQAAPAWSLSGNYGRNAFPWHTDGAISNHPPRWIVLRAVRLSTSTSTWLLDPDPALLSLLRSTVLRAEDRVGHVRYVPAFVPINSQSHRIRWDPRTCIPRKASTLDNVESIAPSVDIQWQQLDQVLIFDNFRMLHRRPAVASDAVRVLERRYVWGG